jgi:hypothetical protein
MRKGYLALAFLALVLIYEYVMHVVVEGKGVSSILPSVLYYSAVVVPFLLWSLSRIEKRERELARRERELKNFIESTRDAVFEVDAGGYFTFMNQAGAEMAGLSSPEEVIGRHATEFWADPRDREAYLKELLEKGYVRKYPMRARRADGEPAYWELTSNVVRDDDGNFAGIRGICRDVTRRVELEEKLEAKVRERTAELERSEKALRRRGERLEALSTAASEVTRVLDYNKVLRLAAEKARELVDAETVAVPILSRDGSLITYPAASGRHARRIMGRQKPLEQSGICGWVIRERKPFYSEDIASDPRELEEVKREFNLRSAIAAPLIYGGRVFGGLTALNKRGGGAFTREDLHLLSIFASNVAVALRNASLMGEVRRYAERLKRSNELKDLFTDIMRHDLLNPVSVIKGFADLLLMDESLSEHQRKCLGKIRRGTEKLEEMVRNASKLSKLQDIKKLELEEMDISEILEGVIRELRPLFEEKRLVLDFRKRKCIARVNPLIEDVFYNLLTNAVKYSYEEGKVEVEVSRVGDSCRVMVKDYGVGVPDEAKEKIFRRFTTLDKKGVRGVGLGLAIARRIVELHRGRIWVEDNPMGGSIFYVSLPV